MLRDAVAHLNRLDPRPDAVVITGDLADKGDPLAYAHLREILAELADCASSSFPAITTGCRNSGRAFADQPYLPAEGDSSST